MNCCFVCRRVHRHHFHNDAVVVVSAVDRVNVYDRSGVDRVSDNALFVVMENDDVVILAMANDVTEQLAMVNAFVYLIPEMESVHVHHHVLVTLTFVLN